MRLSFPPLQYAWETRAGPVPVTVAVYAGYSGDHERDHHRQQGEQGQRF